MINNYAFGEMWWLILKMWWLIGSSPDFWDRGPWFESGISHNDPDALQDHCLIMYSRKSQNSEGNLPLFLQERAVNIEDHPVLTQLLARLVVMLPDMPDEALEAFAREWRDKRPYLPRRKA